MLINILLQVPKTVTCRKIMKMAQKEIQLLHNLVQKLDEKSFDLDAWKKQTLLFLTRIFGQQHTIVSLINDLKYDYSSWNLRDATGNEKSDDPVKMQAKEILEAAILEVETLGLPEKEQSSEKLWEYLEEELTGKQLKEIKSILDSGDENKLERVESIMGTLEKENLANILSRLLTGV